MNLSILWGTYRVTNACYKDCNRKRHPMSSLIHMPTAVQHCPLRLTCSSVLVAPAKWAGLEWEFRQELSVTVNCLFTGTSTTLQTARARVLVSRSATHARTHLQVAPVRDGDRMNNDDGQ